MKKTSLMMTLTVLALGLLSACATFSKASERNLYQVHVGQTKAELIAAMGEPDKIDVDGGQEHWHYVILSTNARTTYPYIAVFENEKLARWDFDTSTVQKQREEEQNRRRPSSVEGRL